MDNAGINAAKKIPWWIVRGLPNPAIGMRHSEESKEKMRRAKLGKKMSPEARIKMSLGKKGTKQSEEWKRKKNAAVRGQKRSPESIKRISEAQILLRRTNPEYKAKMDRHNKQLWQNPKTREAIIEKTSLAWNYDGPNKAELRLLAILEEMFPGEWKYVGNGHMFIDGRVPDFFCKSKRMLIELFGDYWHRGKDPQERIDHFAKYGFETMVIWEHEMKDREAMTKR